MGGMGIGGLVAVAEMGVRATADVDVRCEAQFALIRIEIVQRTDNRDIRQRSISHRSFQTAVPVSSYCCRL
jgi:HSP20 family molecular chaperone IbpA